MSIISFPGKEPLARQVWVCNCGCISHLAYADGTLECASCGAEGNGAVGEWREKLPVAPKEPHRAGGDTRRVITLDSPEVGLRRTLKDATPENTKVLIVVNGDGIVSTWGMAVADEEWLDQRLAEAKEFLMQRGRK